MVDPLIANVKEQD